MSKHSSRGTAWEKTRVRVLARDGGICGYCGRDATTVDHITPKAAGGTDDDANLIASCKPCNSQKQDKILPRVNYFNPRWIDRL